MGVNTETETHSDRVPPRAFDTRDGPETGWIPRSFESYADEPLEQAPAGGAGKSGVCEAEFSVDRTGQTRLTHDRSKVPFHLTGARPSGPPDGLASLQIQTPTGPIAQGDRHRISLRARERARALVRSQSATKVHGMSQNCGQISVELDVGPDAVLEYIPEYTILFGGARLCKTVDIRVAAGGTAIVSDTLVPGRLAREERFDFEALYTRVSARDSEGLVVVDAQHVEPAETAARGAGVLGDNDVLGSLYVISGRPDSQALASSIHDALDEQTRVLGSASTLRDGRGVLARAVADSRSDVSDAIHEAWSVTREAIFGAGTPPRRRY